jgi:16S rRNA processing protein RimM
MTSESRVEIARVVSVNPAKHEVRVKPIAAHARQLNALHTGWLAGPGATPVRVRIESMRPDRGMIILRVAAGVPRDTVRSFDHGTLWIPAEALAPPEPEAWTIHDWVGMSVENEEGERVGEIVEVLEAPANDVITVQRPDQSRFLLPVVPEVILAVDFEAEVVRVGDMTAFAVDDAH